MIRLEHVTKYFGAKKVLDDIHLEIKKGETFVIVGFSGAGKSVTLKHLIQLLRPDVGRILIDGEDISQATGNALEHLRERFGMLFQEVALQQWLSAGENVALQLREKTDLSDADIKRRVDEKLKLVNLEDVYDLYPIALSGGMKKRVGLARAIIMDPEIILYDEPTAGLDPVTSRAIDQLIDRLRNKLNVTGVVVTHDLFSALSIGTRIAMIYEGRIIEVSTPSAFIRSSNPVVKRFLEAQYITKRGFWEREYNETK